MGILESRSLEGELEKRSLEGKGKEGRNEKGMDLSEREWPYKWRIVNLGKKLQNERLQFCMYFIPLDQPRNTLSYFLTTISTQNVTPSTIFVFRFICHECEFL